MEKTTKEIYDSVQNTCAASDEFKELMDMKWIRFNNEIQEAIALYKHLKRHPEVINAPVNPGQPMCKICNKTAKQIEKECV